MASSTEPLVSVVTPVYDGAETVAECIESVLGQTYRNWEYVIVNNRSNDASREIALAYAAKDSRIRIHDNETLVGPTENHHVGFRLMSPESRYCKVVQADDWIFPECLERMVLLAEAHPKVGVVGAYRLSDRWVTFDGWPYPSTVVRGSEACRKTLLDRRFSFGSETSTLLRAEIVRDRDPFYDVDSYPLHCDLAVFYEVLQDWDFGFVHQVLTFSGARPAALTSRAERLQSTLAERLRMLDQFGARFLTPGELSSRRQEMLREYRCGLGKSILFRRADAEFWDFHQGFLKEVGLSAGPFARVGFAASAILDTLGSPLRVLGRGWQQRRSA